MKKIFLLILVCLFSSCSLKREYQSSMPALITIKSPMVKISDTGFIKQDGNFINLQIFSAGVLVFDMKLDKDICINKACYQKLIINKKFLKNSHYENILNDILSFSPIYEKKNLKKIDGGFNQKIFKKNAYEINYIVKQGNLSYKDNLNNIALFIKFLK